MDGSLRVEYAELANFLIYRRLHPLWQIARAIYSSHAHSVGLRVLL